MMARLSTLRRPHACQRLWICLVLLALAACSAGQSPHKGDPVAPAEAMQQFGKLRVRYNALPSLAMNANTARTYGIDRGAGRALIVVVLKRMDGAEERPAQGEVSGVATDLSGRRQPIAFHPVRTGDSLDYIGLADISAHDTLRFALEVRSADGGGTLRFERAF